MPLNHPKVANPNSNFIRIKEPNYISKRNRRGIIYLFFICLFILFLPRVITFFKDEPEVLINTEIVNRFEKTNPKKQKVHYSKKKEISKYSRPPRKFNPNEYQVKDWMALGLSIKQSEVVFSFISRGISSNQALEKIYVLPEELYNMIKDSTYYDMIEEAMVSGSSPQDEDSSLVKTLLEINGANKEELIALYGIGEFYAKQIIKYRDELGGFYVKEQLLEVWKMRLETYEKLLTQIRVDSSLIKKISINQVTIDELKTHPYLDYYQANSIVKMREQRQGFQHMEEILESKLIDEEQYERLLPYLSL